MLWLEIIMKHAYVVVESRKLLATVAVLLEQHCGHSTIPSLITLILFIIENLCVVIQLLK